MSEIVLRQPEALAYVQSISDQVERVLTEAALCRAISFLMTDAEYASRWAQSPFDLLLFTKATHALFTRKEMLAKILDGKYASVEEIDDVF